MSLRGTSSGLCSNRGLRAASSFTRAHPGIVLAVLAAIFGERDVRPSFATVLRAMDAGSRPALRPVESIVVPDKQHGRVLVLRDMQGVTDAHAVVPPVLVPVVGRFNGGQTCEEIARSASEEIGIEVPVEIVVRLAEELEQGLFLDAGPFRAALARIEREFAQATVRPASHAGAAYHGERRALESYIDRGCIAKANGGAAQSSNGSKMVALVSPHIDPWRGAVTYGHAYGALLAALPTEADTFVLFGTSHAPMRQPFALCRKAFATPLGTVEADLAAIDALAACAQGFDPFADQINHKREHSLEFQVVFLKHLLKDRPLRIVPILAGLGPQQVSGEDPAANRSITRFLDGVRDLSDGRPGRVVVVAGADLAHIGPRFGDESPLGAEERAQLERADRTSIERATSLDARGFWDHVSGDLDERRICGLAPIWSLLRTLSIEVRGRLLHYEQTVDAEDGSIVSHAAVGFYG
jgi:MEMO1 family protein